MKRDQNNQQQLHETLKTAYFQQEHAGEKPGSRWTMDVMREIRRIGPLNAQVNPFLFFERVVWRFSTAACAIILLLSVYAGVTGWNPVDEMMAQFLSNPVEFTVAQALGSYENYE